jgi:hypothetical protein
MVRRIEADEYDAWDALFTSFERSAYRLEGLQTYAEPDEAEAVARFLDSGELDPDVLSWWTGLVRGHVATGRSLTRVRVIVEPLTDYTRFELACYRLMVEAGDDIRMIVAPPGGWPASIPQHDYWLFDDRDVWVMHYSNAGTFIRAELAEDPAVIADHLRWRDVAMAQAIPVHDYLATLARRRAS